MDPLPHRAAARAARRAGARDSPTLSAIVLRLLAKNAEDRYQTARGVEADLRQCLSEWEWAARIEASRSPRATCLTGC